MSSWLNEKKPIRVWKRSGQTISEGPRFNFCIFVHASFPAWNFIFSPFHLTKSYASQGPVQGLLHSLNLPSTSSGVQIVGEAVSSADHNI